ncbi:hypothetical protein [Streptomyces sp. NBC_00572]|uniref:hypothetical protein n=1 Tax=Streptomyces sp. NBC_00572 TaxID=2903664 RepID=UPI002254FC67|nr:hypothetical protein [Streptomyces sp. NBC_00572]MCX4986918.1 hypothetical protein [Streptomyces sp. NBC_00572]
MRVTTLAAVAALAGVAILGSSTAASAAPEPIDTTPVVGTLDGLVGAVSAPLATANIVCPAPWKQSGFGLQDYYVACIATPVASR